MKPNDQQTESGIDSTGPDIPALESYPAGKNHEDLLLCGPENDTQWVMSDTFRDVKEVR